MNHYETLGVLRSASIDDIRGAYRKLAMKWHPDRHQSDADKEQAEARFKAIQQAYSTLSDEASRRRYDQSYSFFGHGFGTGPGRSTSSAERDSSSAGRSSNGRSHQDSGLPRGADIKWKTAVPLSAAIHGGPIAYKRKEKIMCSACDGKGHDVYACPQCHGDGFSVGKRGRVSCTKCKRTGRVEIACRHCKGKGAITETVTTTIRMPAGMVDGSEIVVRGYGQESEFGKDRDGDLVIKVSIKPEAGFTFSDCDIKGNIKVPFSVAMLGGLATVDLPTGVQATVTIPARSNSGKKLTFQGLGLASAKAAKTGDAILSVVVVLPKSKRKLSLGEEAFIRSLDS